MAEQRQPFRFRLPWLAAPAAPRPSQVTQAPYSPESPAGPSQPAAPAQRRPFRPVGSAAPPTRLPSSRAEPPPASSSSTQTGPSFRATLLSAAQRQIAPPPRGPDASPSRAVPRTQSPSPSRGVGLQAKSIAPVTKPPTAPRSAALELEHETKPLLTQKRQPSTTEIPEPQKEQREQESSLPSPPKPLFMDTKTPQTEKVVQTLKGKDELLASEQTKVKQSQVSVPKPASKRELRNEVYEASSKEPMEILKRLNHEEPKKNPVTQKKAQDSKAKTEGHPDAVLNELGQHPREEVFDQKEILKIFGSNQHDTKREHFDHEKGSRFNHKHANTEEKNPLGKEMKEDLPKIIHKQGTRRDNYALPFNIITLTGENTGATMHLSSEPAKRERSIHIHRGYKANADESVDTVTDSEGRSRGRKPTNTKVEKEPGKKIYVNNNVQGINNSFVFNSSVTERNPGAHVVLSREAAESVKPGKEVETHDTHKAEMSTAPAERLTYAPNIRRRCLRGLFLESSDSDPENSEKPRRHGCRAGCS